MSKTPATPKFKTGDIVRLVSGGPDMAVRQLVMVGMHNERWSGSYECQWFAGKKLEKGSFPQDSLEKAPAPEKKSS